MDENSNLISLADEKIQHGLELLKSLSKFSKLEGIGKLHRKVKQEIDFLRRICRDGTIKKDHLQCTNMTHFTACVKTLEKIEKCQSVSKAFHMDGKKIIVDIVCDEGLSWVKVVAKNPKSLNQISMGDASFGVRSVLDQAKEYLEYAQLYPCLFQIPKIIFVFAHGIGCGLAAKLEALGIIVEGDRIKDLDLEIDTDTLYQSELSTRNTAHINKVNLDVSAMLAYCSSVTNGSCNKYKLSTAVLTQQAEWESKRPVKPILDAFFKDKKLYCCETARDSFLSILNTVGGPNERIRGEEFLKSVTVLPDNATALDTIETNANAKLFEKVQLTPDKTLQMGGKIRERSLMIFTFGDRIQAITVTSNDGFIRAAKYQGINFVVFVHESRALTEQKEMKATRIDQ